MENKSYNIEKLLKDHVDSIREEYWSEQFKHDLEQALAKHGIHDLKIYKNNDDSAYILTICNYQPNTDFLVKDYHPRTALIKMAPFITVVWAIFFFTALIAQNLKALMSAEFLFCVPFFIGALSHYMLNFQQPAGAGKMAKQQSMIFLLVLLPISVLVLKEGTICIIMASPLLVGCQIIGASIMLGMINHLWRPSPRIYSLAVVPLLLILINPFATRTLSSTTQNEVVINASAEQVFKAINDIQAIQPHELKNSPVFWMGFPKPVSGMTVQQGDDLTRQIHWQRGIYFEEAITHYQPNQMLGWIYRFSKDSFPKGSLDDHVEIGGEYLDLAHTDYRLEAITPTQTKLILTIDYRLSTEFNWYSKLWTDYVLNEFSDVVLNVYKSRLEQQGVHY